MWSERLQPAALAPQCGGIRQQRPEGAWAGRCWDHGITGFKRYIALAVVARNVQRLGAILKAEPQKRKRRDRKRGGLTALPPPRATELRESSARKSGSFSLIAFIAGNASASNNPRADPGAFRPPAPRKGLIAIA